MTMTTTNATTGGVAWNGGVCHLCSRLYLGSHRCSPIDLLDRAEQLQRIARERFEEMNPQEIGCACGNRGACASVLCAPKVTC
ncbi:hypothetical protein F9L07_19720 [Pimelobacter simplex]|uniref:Uncharacterized protein n=1 Tax=Nocardioides simplex TaxID=2045 RepID=A0A7J5DVI2_NOCSI|nr:hypothetical protein [Pimelobacter simplex]KAB2809272.1 hypothetical protein F9L07_19720 [Pimelobacter simplex]